jgi:hypothetical protein
MALGRGTPAPREPHKRTYVPVVSAASPSDRSAVPAPACYQAKPLRESCNSPSGQEKGSSALASFLSKLTETGDPVLIKRPAANYAHEVDVCELATDNGSGRPQAGLVLQFSAGVRYNAMSVISASPNDECGIWGSDLQAELILTGTNTDWPLVNRIWAVLVTLWSAIAWDEMSGFEVNKDAPGPA